MSHYCNKKSQSSIEFAVLVGALLVAFIFFLSALTQTLGEKNIEKRNTEFFELATSVQNELNIAGQTSNGYKRIFTIPNKIEGFDYQIQIIEGQVYLNSTEGNYAVSIPGQIVTGQLNKGQNTIRKEQGAICLNPNPPTACPP